MANLLLTEKCVRSCPYCFAKKYMDGAENVFIGWDAIVKVADMHIKSNEPAISLLGGEPTLHPNYVDIVLYLLSRGLHVNTFTSGIASDSKLTQIVNNLSGLDPCRLSFVVNYNSPLISSDSENERTEAFFNSMALYTSLSFNIYNTTFDMMYLVDAIVKKGLRRHIRIGLAHPIVGNENMCVSKNDLKDVGKQLVLFASKMESLGISMGFDCGIPMCIFDDKELGMLFKMMMGRLDFKCGPAIDIGPDLTVWPCFPLSQWHRKKLSDFNSFREVRSFYSEMHGRVRGELAGLYDDCDDCRYRETEFCSGGCLSHQLSIFNDEEGVRFPEVYLDNINKKTIAPPLSQKM